MIKPSTLAFLRKLSKNNSREWFHANKALYDAARENVFEVSGRLIEAVGAFDRALGSPDPRKSLFRTARDTRWSRDKSPYKANFGLSLNPEGRTRSALSSYYVHVEPNNCAVAAGAYMLDADLLKTVRDGIVMDFDEFSAIISKRDFASKIGDLVRDEDALARVPAGFDKNSPAAEYLKLRHFYVSVPLSDAEATSADFVKKAAALFKVMHPFNRFLNGIISKKTAPEKPSGGKAQPDKFHGFLDMEY